MRAGLGREEIRALLDDLSQGLTARDPGPRCGVHPVRRGPARRCRLAEREGLAEDWLNDAVKGSCPGPTRTRSASTPATRSSSMSPRPGYLLAMKLFAARAEIDADDIILLYRQLGFTTVDEGLGLVQQAYPGRRSRPK